MYDRIQEKAKQYPIVSSDCSVCLIHICYSKKDIPACHFPETTLKRLGGTN